MSGLIPQSFIDELIARSDIAAPFIMKNPHHLMSLPKSSFTIASAAVLVETSSALSCNILIKILWRQ